MNTFTVKLSIPADNIELTVDNSTFSMGVESPIVMQAIEVPVYEGSYELTPTAEAQTIPVHGYRFEQDLIIDPIPSNYGLITWNGSELIVS